MKELLDKFPKDLFTEFQQMDFLDTPYRKSLYDESNSYEPLGTKDLYRFSPLPFQVIPEGVLPPESGPREKPIAMSIQELLEWEPDQLTQHLYHLDRSRITIAPTRHALSQAGTKPERQQLYQGMLNFLADPDIAASLDQEFHVAAKAFRGRPPLHIVADSRSDVTGIHKRYEEYIFQSVNTSMYFVLHNEHHPLASIGFNQFADGIEIRYVQGVKTSKIGDSAKDFDRLGNGLEKLVGLVERYAEYQGLDYVMVLPVSENIWVKPESFPVERAKRIYDDMAGRRGYDYNQKLKRFMLKLR